MLKIVSTQSSVGVLQKKISWLDSSVAFVDIYSCIFKAETSRLLPTLRWHHACIFYTWCLYSVHTMYILHLHTSYLLTLVAVVEHMVGFRTIACLSLGLVIFLMFFSPLTHIVSIIIVVTYYFLFVSLYIHTRKYGRLCRPIFSPFGYGKVKELFRMTNIWNGNKSEGISEWH